MDFAQRGMHQNQTAAPAASGGGTAPAANHPSPRRQPVAEEASKWLRVVSVALLISVAIVLFGTVMALSLGREKTREGQFVNGDQYQAVFLNGGQVYFGKVVNLNPSYVRLIDIYYLRVNQQVQPNQGDAQTSNNDVSLVKLGCELHGPQDEMLINRDQVVFWENLKTDGEVAQAVAKYKEQNPEGQKCDAPADSSTNQTTTTPAENDGN